MNKLKITIAILALASLFFGQCACPYVGDEPTGSLGTQESRPYWNDIRLVDTWQAEDAQWTFGDGGILKITDSAGDVTDALWVAKEKELEIIINKESTLYKVYKLSDKKIKLSGFDREVLLVK